MEYYSCDFETNNSETHCRVWLYGIYNIYTEDFLNGNTISDFLDEITNLSKHESITCAFHNLKFDGNFILNYLLRNGYAYTSGKVLKEQMFKCLISDMGVWYSVTIKNMYGHNINIINTLNLLPFSVHEISQAFGLYEKKGKIDYDYIRPVDYKATPDEVDYVKNDCVIVGKAWRYLIESGDLKLTTGSNALNDYKNIIGKKSFEHYFPRLSDEEDEFVRGSYKGGWVYANPKYQNKVIGEGLIFDVNSLYPSRLKFCPMPYGKGTWFGGKYQGDKDRPLYVQKLECSFKIKKGYVPTIQLHNTPRFLKTEYVTDTEGEAVELTLTNIDLELFFKHYNVDVRTLVYKGGYKYKSANGMFDAYIDKWMAEKEEATKEGNKPRRTLAKLKLNALYGKFAKRPKGMRKHPELEDGVLKLRAGDIEEQNTLYIPVGTFTTAYARYFTITNAQKNIKRFLYADTDSLHLEGTEIPKDLDIDDTKLGMWALEGKFRRGKYLGAKCYCEEIYTKKEKIIEWLRGNGESYQLANMHNLTLLSITCAGLPDKCKSVCTFDNFAYGAIYDNKLKPKSVENGVILEKTTFEIKNRLTKRKL